MSESMSCPEVGCDRDVSHVEYDFNPEPSSDLPLKVGEDSDGEPILVDPDDVPEEGAVEVGDGDDAVLVTRDDVTITPAGPTEEYVCLIHGLVEPQ